MSATLQKVVALLVFFLALFGRSENGWGKPDLMISSRPPIVTPTIVAPGETVQLSAGTIKNQGAGTSGFFTSCYYLSTDATITSSDILLDTYILYSLWVHLPAGASVNMPAPTLTIPAQTVSGDYYIGILVDAVQQVVESNEGNNYVSIPIKVEDVLCGQSHGENCSNLIPAISTLGPNSGAAGGPGFIIQVMGSNFVEGSVV